MVKWAYTDGQKSISVSDLDGFMDWLVNQNGEDDGEIKVSTALQKVAFVYRGVQLIANALRAMPWRIENLDGSPYDAYDSYENKLGYLPNPKRLNELLTRSILGTGYGYLFKVTQGRAIKNLKYVVPQTIKPLIDQRGLYAWERTIEGVTTKYPLEQIAYWYPADDSVEVGPPTFSAVKAGLMAAGANYYTSRFIADFFARGAIKGTLIAVKGNPPKQERERIKDWFTRTFARGMRSSFGTDVINADAMEPIKIGEGLESLNNSELTTQMREDIAVAMGIPMSKLLSATISGMGGGGVAESDDIAFYRDTVQPLGEFISDQWNTQFFTPAKLRWVWLWDTIDVFQQDEKERSIAVKTYVDAGAPLGTTMYMLGVELPEDVELPPQYKAMNELAEQKREAMQEQMQGNKPGEEPENSTEQQAEIAKERAETQGTGKRTDLDKWLDFAVKRFDEGHPEKALGFESDEIAAETMQAIKYAMGLCVTSSDVVDVFKHVTGKATRFIPRGADEPLLPVPDEVIIDESDIDAAVKAWDKKMPDFAGLLDADIVNRTTFEDENA